VEAGAFFDFDHAAGVGDAGGEGFFDEGVAAAFEGGDGLLGVEVVGAGDDDYIGVGLVEEFFVVGAGSGIGIDFEGFFELCAYGIEEADDVAAAVGGGYVGAVEAGSACAADQEFHWRHSVLVL